MFDIKREFGINLIQEHYNFIHEKYPYKTDLEFFNYNSDVLIEKYNSFENSVKIKEIIGFFDDNFFKLSFDYLIIKNEMLVSEADSKEEELKCLKHINTLKQNPNEFNVYKKHPFELKLLKGILNIEIDKKLNKLEICHRYINHLSNVIEYGYGVQNSLFKELPIFHLLILKHIKNIGFNIYS